MDAVRIDFRGSFWPKSLSLTFLQRDQSMSHTCDEANSSSTKVMIRLPFRAPPTVESRIGLKGGFGLTPGKLLTLQYNLLLPQKGEGAKRENFLPGRGLGG